MNSKIFQNWCKRNKILCESYVVFFISFIFMISLTYNFQFFWEDYGAITSKDKVSASQVIQGFKEIFFDTSDLVSVSYYNRPLAYWYYATLQKYFFGEAVLKYRILKTFLFAIHSTLIFLFLRLLRCSLLSSILISSLFITSPQSWVSALYIMDDGVIMHLLTFLSVLCFYISFIQKRCSWILGILALFLLRLSILIKNEGRVLFFPFLLLFIFFNKRIFNKFRYVIIFIVGIILMFPFLNLIINPILNVNKPMFELPTINSTSDFSLLELFLQFFQRLNIPLETLGYVSFIFLILGIALSIKKIPNDPTLLFFISWFISALVMVFLARRFDYPVFHWQRHDFYYSLTPFFISLGLIIKPFIKNYKKIVCNTIYLLLFIALLTNLYSLNQWRGAWGEYFLGWGTVIGNIENQSNSAVVVMPESEFDKPTYSKTIDLLITGQYMNVSFLNNLSLNYADVFISLRGTPLNNSSQNLELINIINAKDNSPYGWIKSRMGRGNKQAFYIYKFNLSNK